MGDSWMTEAVENQSLQSQMELLTSEMHFTNCPDDFVTYEELQRGALKLGMSVPTRDQIDEHMKWCHKMFPTYKNRREGFQNYQFDFERLKNHIENSEIKETFIEDYEPPNASTVNVENVEKPNIEKENGQSDRSKRPREDRRPKIALPPSLSTCIRKFHSDNQGKQPDGLTAKLRQDEKDRSESRRLKKEIIVSTALFEKDANSENSENRPSAAFQLAQLQKEYIDLLERRVQSLDDILQRNLL